MPSLPAPNFSLTNFKQTCFQVWAQDDWERAGEPFLAVQPVGSRSYEGVGPLLAKHDASFAALLTAWNPGRLETPEFNEEANLRLLETLNASGLAIYPARGTSLITEEGKKPWFEDSFLVVGGTYEQYVVWQQAFEQLAFVIFRTDGAVELRW